MQYYILDITDAAADTAVASPLAQPVARWLSTPE
jgi:hypothetical protein